MIEDNYGRKYIYTKVIGIDQKKNKIKVRLYLPNGELERYMQISDTLKELDLIHIGAEFYYIAYEENNEIKIKFELIYRNIMKS